MMRRLTRISPSAVRPWRSSFISISSLLARSTALKKRAFLPALIMLRVAFPRAGSAYQDDVTLVVEEATAGELCNQLAVYRRILNGEVGEFLDERQFGGPQLVVDGSRLLGRDLGFEQRMDHPLHALLALDAHRDDLIVGCPHAR